MPDPNRTAAHVPPDAVGPPETVDATVDATGERTNPPPPPGAPVIPGYAVTGMIARGGMGCVFAGRDLTLDREIAVKTLLPGADPDRFVTEAKITARLPHPGIPPVHALGTLADGGHYLVMKLIRGRTLADLLKERPSPAADLSRFVQVFESIAQAVGFAHSRGILHRDLKPLNVMVGEFGEVQVMDWGLAKEQRAADAAGPGTDPAADTADLTRAGTVMGTPGYMAPEQARGEAVDARADVFALGSVLAAILTGKPAFVGTTARETIGKAAAADVAGVLARLDGCGADAELVGVARRCLAAAAADRPADARAVAVEVAGYRAGVESRLRQAETDRAKAEVQAAEQRKRRRVQLALAGFVVLVAVGGGIVALQVQAQRERDRIAADEQTRQKERETRASALVDSLAGADSVVVPRTVSDLADLRDLARPRLAEMASQPVTTKAGLHARLALLPDEPQRANELAAYLSVCRPEELLTIRNALQAHAGTVAPGLWAVLLDAKADAGRRVRAACALAGLTPDDPRWAEIAPGVAGIVVRAAPGEFVVWSKALEPVRGELLPGLVAAYPKARDRLRSGKVPEADLGSEAAAFEFTADLLARYSADRPEELAELALTVDGRHYPQFADPIRANRAEIVPLLGEELRRSPGPVWALDGGGVALAGVAGCPVSLDALDPDPVLAERAKRRGHAAAVLLMLGEAESVWPVFRFPMDGDPTARSYLLQRLGGIGADPASLVRRFEAEEDVSARRALLVALGDFPPELVPEREAFAGRLLVLYREHPDPGLHAAIDWVLRQRWGKAAEVAAIDAELAKQARGQVVARSLVDLGPGPLRVGSLLPAPPATQGNDWYVNGEGQTFAVVRGPVEFTLGSPESEPGRTAQNEPAHRKRIGRTFAIATKEVTVEQFLRFRPKHSWVERYSPGPDTPAVEMTWYEAAAYCNWLSEREGIPRDQWCYEPNQAGDYAEGMRMKAGHLELTGYRLPTESEWEYACRGGAATSRYYGRGEELLPRYGWFVKTSEDRVWPVGGLRSNERGLFDALGNAFEWCEDPALLYATGQSEDVENSRLATIDGRKSRMLRGGSFVARPAFVRSAERGFGWPGGRTSGFGFRPVRTLP